jgi:hypothetical protein
MMRSAVINDEQITALGLDEDTVSDHLYHAAVALLAMLADSPPMCSMCLAFCDGAAAVSRALRMRRVGDDWGARVCALGAAACLARVDDAAAEALLAQGLFATVEQSLFVRFHVVGFLTTCWCRTVWSAKCSLSSNRASRQCCLPAHAMAVAKPCRQCAPVEPGALVMQAASRERDWLSVHLALDTLATFVTSSPSAATQALACPLLETLANLLAALSLEVSRAAQHSSRAPAARPQHDAPSTGAPASGAAAGTNAALTVQPRNGPLSVRVAALWPPSPLSAGPLNTPALAASVLLGEELDCGLVLKVVRLASHLAGSAPAHRNALVHLGLAGTLLGLLTACRAGTAAAEAATASDDGAAAGGSFRGVAEALGEVVIEALWALVRLVDEFPEGQKAVLLADGMPTLAGCAMQCACMRHVIVMHCLAILLCTCMHRSACTKLVCSIAVATS